MTLAPWRPGALRAPAMRCELISCTIVPRSAEVRTLAVGVDIPCNRLSSRERACEGEASFRRGGAHGQSRVEEALPFARPNILSIASAQPPFSAVPSPNADPAMCACTPWIVKQAQTARGWLSTPRLRSTLEAQVYGGRRRGFPTQKSTRMLGTMSQSNAMGPYAAFELQRSMHELSQTKIPQGPSSV